MKAGAMDKPMDAAQIFQRLAELAGAYRDGQAEGGYVTYLPPAELARRLELDRPAPPGDWDEIFRWVELYLRYSVKTGHPGYMNRMWSSANLPSVLGEMVTALSNTSACTFETAPVSTLMEQYLLQAMLDRTLRRLPVTNWRKMGMTSNHHALYVLGYTRATMVGTEGSEIAISSEPPKPIPVRIVLCNSRT